MGKKLRNRLIQDTFDQETQTQEECHLPKQEIKHGDLRHIIQKKNFKKSQNHQQKLKKFKARLAVPEFHEIVSETSFECSICLQMMVSPMMMLCGHMYCMKCLQFTNVYNQKCSLCRKDQENQPFVPNPVAERIIHQFLLPSSRSFLPYLCRLTETQEWNKRRKLSYLRPNLVIDFQDCFHMWRKGVVVAIFTKNGRIIAKIKTNNKGVDLFEEVQATSRRIAPFTFFTRKRYLEDFVPSLPEFDFNDRDLCQLEYKTPRYEVSDDCWNFEEKEEKNEIEDSVEVSNQSNHQGIDSILMMLDEEVHPSPHLFN